MSVLDQGKVDRIKNILKWNTRGTTISELAVKMQMNRNLVAKYLDMLLISGQVEMQEIGAAKVYFLAHRVPVSALLEFSSDLVIVLDHDRRIRQVNEQVLLLLSEKRESLAGKRIDEIGDPLMGNIGKLLNEYDPVKARGRVTELSRTVRGEERHFRVRQVPTAFEDGTDGITLIIEDVTSQKKYQQMLEISEARYRGIVQSSGEAIIGMMPSGQITSWNPAAQRLYGYNESEIVTRPVHKLVPETGHQDLDGILARVNGGECIQRYDLKMVRKDGTAIDALVTICPIRGEDHRIVGASSIIRDITRDKLELHVREREDRYRNLVEDLNVGIYRSTGDPAGRFVWGNTALLRILGYRSLTDLEGIRVTDIFSEPEGRSELLEELKKSGFVKNRILDLRQPDGTPITVSVTALAEFDRKKDLVFINGIVQDISGLDRSGTKPAGS